MIDVRWSERGKGNGSAPLVEKTNTWVRNGNPASLCALGGSIWIPHTSAPPMDSSSVLRVPTDGNLLERISEPFSGYFWDTPAGFSHGASSWFCTLKYAPIVSPKRSGRELAWGTQLQHSPKFTPSLSRALPSSSIRMDSPRQQTKRASSDVEDLFPSDFRWDGNVTHDSGAFSSAWEPSGGTRWQ